MAYKFEIAKDLVVDATPEQVWDAIATGPGMDSWFMGSNEIEPREGGKARLDLSGYTETSTVTTWDPPHRFSSTGSEAADGSFHRFDYRLDPREGGGTTIRFVHSGMLGEDWEREYEGMSEGDPMYLQKLVEYVTYFAGRHAVPIHALGPRVDAERSEAMATFRRALGLSGEVAEGDEIRLAPDGLDPIEGVVDWVSPSFLGVRADDALYRFIRGYEGTVMVGHHLFRDGVDRQQTEGAWRAWLARVFAR